MNMPRGFRLKPPVTNADVEEQARADREAQNPIMAVLLVLANHFKKLLITVGAVIFSAIFLFIALEDDFSLLNPVDWIRAFYWAFTTASTTGYGDISPASLPGMVMVATFMALMFLLNTLFQAAVTARLVIQADKFSHREQEDAELDRKNTRAMVQFQLERSFGMHPDMTWDQAQAHIQQIVQDNIINNNVILDEMERQAEERAHSMS